MRTVAMPNPVRIDWEAKLAKMWDEENAFVGKGKLSMPFGSAHRRLEAGEITEEQFVDMLVARGISLLEADGMSDDELVTQLTIVGTTVRIGSFENMTMPRFSESAMDALRNGPDIVDVLVGNVKEDMRADGVLPG